MPKVVKKSRKCKSKVLPTQYEVGSAAAATAVVGLVFCSLESLRLLNGRI